MKKIKEIRFLPMDKKEEFPEFSDVILYLFKTLPIDQEGRFYYRSQHFTPKGKTLILFQYDAQLIAYGYIIDIDEYDTKFEKGIQYEGCYIFDPDSIRIFTNGFVDADEYRENVDKNLKTFGQGTRKTDTLHKKEVCDLIKKHI